MLFGEHTWGPDVARYAGYSYGDEWKKKLAAGQYRFLLEGFNQKRAYAHRAAELVEPAIRKRMAALAEAVDVPGRRIVVFNPLPWTRDGAVEVPWTGTTTALDRRRQPSRPSRPSRETARLRFVARNLPPLGYRTFVPAASGRPRGNVSADANAQCIENELLRVTLDPARCGIKSIVDKRTGRELVNAQSPYALGQYLYERFDADQGLRHAHAYVTHRPNQDPGEIGCQSKPKSALGQGASLLRGDGGGRDRARSAATRRRPRPCSRRPRAASFPTPRNSASRFTPASLGWTWSGRSPTRRPIPGPRPAGSASRSAPTNPTFRLARLGSIVDPAKDLVRSSNHDVFCLNGGLTVEGADGSRTGICPIDAQLVSLERPGLWHYSRDFVAHKPDVFVMLFNNVYSTNFAQWIDGSWSSRVRLWPIDRRESTAVVADRQLVGGPRRMPGRRIGRRAGQAAAAGDRPGRREAGVPRSRSRVMAGPSSRGPLVTAFGPNPYGEGTLLRFWEQAGDGGALAVHLPRGMNVGTAQPCDLRGQPTGSPITVSDGVFNATDPVHGPGKFHPPDADAGVAALSRALDDFLEACISMAVLDRRARNRNPKRKRG